MSPIAQSALPADPPQQDVGDAPMEFAPVQPAAPPMASVYPMPPAPMPPAPRGRARSAAAASQPPGPVYPWRKPGYFRNGLDAYIPRCGSVKFWKRDDRGRLHSIPGSWRLQDLDVANDVEEYIAVYLVPKFGPGEYEVALILNDGQVTQQVPYIIADAALLNPRPADPYQAIGAKLDEALSQKGGDMNPLLMQAVAELRADLRARNVAPPPGPVMPLPPPEPALDIAAIVTALATAMKPAAPLPSPPPVERFGVKDIMALVPTVQALLAAITNPGKEIAALQAATAQRANEQLSEALDDVRDELKAMRSVPPRTFRDTIDEIKVVREATTELGFRKDEPGSFGAAIVEVVKNLPKVLDSAGGLADRIRAREAAQAQAAQASGVKLKQPAPAAPAPEPEPEIPDLPQPFLDTIKQIAGQDAAGRVEHVVAALGILLTHPFWGPQVREFIEFAQKDQKDKLIAEFGDMLVKLSQHRQAKLVLPVAEIAPTMQAITDHIDEIIAEVKNNVKEK